MSFSSVCFSYPEWTLKVAGKVNHPITLTLEELAAIPQTTVSAPLYCFGRLVTSGDWSGVQLSLLLEKVEYDKNVKSVQFYATDGYTVNIPIAEALREDVIIAYKKDEQLLPETLRLVIPGANGELWISMINQLILSIDETTISQSEPDLRKIIQPSPTPQQSPTPQPTSKPEATPSASPLPSTTTKPLNSESAPVALATTAIAALTVIIGSAGLLTYLKKRKA